VEAVEGTAIASRAAAFSLILRDEATDALLSAFALIRLDESAQPGAVLLSGEI
jgi:hypothetical protein